MEKQSLRLAVYCRVSSDSQTDNTSLSNQLRRIKQWLEVNGYEQAGQPFIETASAAAGKERPMLDAAVTLALSDRADGIVAIKLDRVARSIRDGCEIMDRLQKAGKHLLCTDDPIDTASPIGEAMVQIMWVFAELERKTIAQRTSAGLQARKAEGKHVSGLAPFGYRLEPSPDGRGTIQVKDKYNEETGLPGEYHTVLEIVGLHRIKGLSPYRIAKRLNRGDRNRKLYKTRTGAPWSPQMVTKILMREGYYKPKQAQSA